MFYVLLVAEIYFTDASVYRKEVWRLPIKISVDSLCKHVIVGVAYRMGRQLMLCEDNLLKNVTIDYHSCVCMQVEYILVKVVLSCDCRVAMIDNFMSG